MRRLLGMLKTSLLTETGFLWRRWCTTGLKHVFKCPHISGFRKRYNQVSHLTQDTTWESDKNTRHHHIQESQNAGPFPAGDQNATMNRYDGMADTKH